MEKIGLNITEKEYRSLEAYSYSKIARFAKEGHWSIPHLDDPIESTESMTFGSVVDCMITEPNEFAERFKVVNAPKIAESLINATKEYFNAGYRAFEAAKMAEYVMMFNSTIKKQDTAEKKALECEEYFYSLVESEGMTAIPEDMFRDAFNCRDAILSSKDIGWLFQERDGYELMTQVKLTGQYNDIPLKGMMDLVYVDHNDKTITMYDLKTSSMKESEFEEAYIKFKYFMQASLYTYLMHQFIMNSDEYRGYTVEGFNFIVVNRETKTPLVWIDENFNWTDNLILGKTVIDNWKSCLLDLVKYKSGEWDYHYPVEYHVHDAGCMYLTKLKHAEW